MEALAADALFLGFDSSTQSLKVTALDRSFCVVASDSVNFDADLAHYRTSGGVHVGPAGRVTAPARMWMEAMDKLLLKLKTASFPFQRVKAVSGSGQQHGTVYWKKGARAHVRGLESSQTLLEQLASQLATPDSPVWMDSSTAKQCQVLEEAAGGAHALAKLTGSRAFERFSGPQIRAVYERSPAVYEDTERISLVSSFGASLLLGDYAPIDHSDGAGMNLMDLKQRQWSPLLLEAAAPDLAPRLGPLVAPPSVLGPVHSYHVARYGFSPDCLVIAWSGDNPCSLAGLVLDEPGDVAMSLGTSDTVFAVVHEAHPGIEGHVFPNPVDPSSTSYMLMLCYKNGSLTRQEVRDRCASGSWSKFEEALEQTKPLNNGDMGFYYTQPEILPPLPAGVHRINVKQWERSGSAELKQVQGSFPPATEIRAVVEGQLVAMRGHAERVGLESPPKRIIATGGASASRGILTVMADVFGCPVYTAPSTDSASVGAALRAAHGLACHMTGRPLTFKEFLSSVPAHADSAVRHTQVAAGRSDSTWKEYVSFTEARMRLEEQLLQSVNKS